MLVEPERADLLAEAVGLLAGSEAARADFGSHGRQRVMDLFSVESQATQYIATYNRVLAMKGPK